MTRITIDLYSDAEYLHLLKDLDFQAQLAVFQHIFGILRFLESQGLTYGASLKHLVFGGMQLRKRRTFVGTVTKRAEGAWILG